MFAVIGTWSVDGPLDSEQLAHIADTVRQQPGFVRGYWGQELDDLTSAHAVAFFEDEARAQMMAEGVKAAISSAQLRVVRVLKEA
jgi:phosphate-selective porin